MKLLNQTLAIALSVFLMLSCSTGGLGGDSENEVSHDATVVEVNHDSLLNIGKEIAAKSAKALGGKLKAAMKAGGPPNAVSFCSETAIPITDSLSNEFGVTIQRVAKRNRNPNNILDEASLAVFDEMESLLAAGKELYPVLKQDNKQSVFYAPIVLKGMCVTCHGTEAEISESTRELIQKNYPNDAAIGFMPGELRGLWKITF
jgi:hypothetical protein